MLLDAPSDPAQLADILRQGFDGYVVAGESVEVLVDVVREVAAEGVRLDGDVLRIMVDEMRSHPTYLAALRPRLGRCRTIPARQSGDRGQGQRVQTDDQPRHCMVGVDRRFTCASPPQMVAKMSAATAS